MFECKNIFVLNKKDKEAIVYGDADGHIIRLACEVFDNEEEFRRWKDWSDMTCPRLLCHFFVEKTTGFVVARALKYGKRGAFSIFQRLFLYRP